MVRQHPKDRVRAARRAPLGQDQTDMQMYFISI